MVEAKTDRKGRGRGIVLAGLREARYDAGLTLEQLSAKTAEQEGGKKVHASTISELENLKHGAQSRTARALADALDVSVRELRRGTDPGERPRLDEPLAAEAVIEDRGER